MRNGWAAPPRPAWAAPAALALLLAWMPALAFLGHWPAAPLTPGDPMRRWWPCTDMPRWKDTLSEQERWDLVNCLRTNFDEPLASGS